MTLKTFSNEYIDLNKQLHDAPRGFGGSGYRYGEYVAKWAKVNGFKTALDYGAGQCTLAKTVAEHSDLLIENYDPAIPELSKIKEEKYDLVVCTDVLEHIEPEYLNNVLAHIFKLAGKGVYLAIALKLANKILPDGRNAHLIVESKEWWLEKIIDHINCNVDMFHDVRKDRHGKPKVLIVEIVYSQ